MIQCVSDHNPYDDEPDPIEEAEKWLKQHDDEQYAHDREQMWARAVIECLLAFIEDEI